MVQSSVEWWASALTSSTAVVGALATALGLFALAFSNKAGKLKDEAAEKAQIAADVRISEAHAKSAEANERAAKLEKDASIAQLELEKLKLKTQPRTLTHDQRKIFTAALAKLPKQKIKVMSLSGNPEPMQWATQLRQCLNETGFSDPAFPAPEYRLFGLTPNSDHTTSIVLNNEAESKIYFDNRATNIASAFEKAGIRTQVVFLPQLAEPGEVAVVIFEK
jgi:hypothetical protein